MSENNNDTSLGCLAGFLFIGGLFALTVLLGELLS